MFQIWVYFNRSSLKTTTSNQKKSIFMLRPCGLQSQVGIVHINQLHFPTGIFPPVILIRDHSHLLEGPDTIRGALKIFDTCKGGALKKITTNFPVKFEFKSCSMGLTHNFHGKKGSPKFFKVWRGARKICMIFFFFFASGPPYKCLWTVCK